MIRDRLALRVAVDTVLLAVVAVGVRLFAAPILDALGSWGAAAKGLLVFAVIVVVIVRTGKHAYMGATRADFKRWYATQGSDDDLSRSEFWTAFWTFEKETRFR